MGTTLKKSSQKRLLQIYGDKLIEIANDYHEKEIFKAIRTNSTIEEERYRYKVKELQAKYDIDSITELRFLLSQSGKSIGDCKFCKKQILVYKTRAGSEVRTCDHIAFCTLCDKACNKFQLHSDEICTSCDHRKRADAHNQELLQQMHERNEGRREITIEEVICAFNEKKIIDHLDLDGINDCINFLQQKIAMFMEVKEIVINIEKQLNKKSKKSNVIPIKNN